MANKKKSCPRSLYESVVLPLLLLPLLFQEKHCVRSRYLEVQSRDLNMFAEFLIALFIKLKFFTLAFKALHILTPLCFSNFVTIATYTLLTTIRQLCSLHATCPPCVLS